MDENSLLALYTNRRVIVVLLLGFSSGLPLALTAGTLQAWFAEANINLATIGYLSFLATPYLFKFLWSPLLDHYIPPLFGRRRGWMLITQLILLLCIVVLSTFNPEHDLLWISLLAFIIAFASASQDIAINAYQTETLREAERGVGAAMNIAGYRLAMLASGGVALIIAEHYGWHAAFLFVAACLAVGIVTSLLAPEPDIKVNEKMDLLDAVVKPFIVFFQNHRQALLILLFITSYKFAEAFTYTFANAFLIRGLGFSLTAVGVINKFMPLLGTVLGAFVGGTLLARISLYRSLMLFGWLAAFATLAYALLAYVGPNFNLACGVIFIENFCSGMATSALVALIMSLCDPEFTATQFALLTALSAVGRVLLGGLAGLMAEHMSWIMLYVVAFLLSLPALFVLSYLKASLLNGFIQVSR